MITGDDVTVVIPTHPARGTVGNHRSMLWRAVRSVREQTICPAMTTLVLDTNREGAAVTRNRGLDLVTTQWVAFLDSDDELLPNHLKILIESANLSGADVVYAGCRVVDGAGQPVRMREEWGRFARAFDGDLLRQFSYLPVTSLVRADLAKRARFGPPDHDPTSLYDDWGFYLRLLDLHATFQHIPAITWIWHHHGQNTSGQPDRGDAAANEQEKAI
jgi:hypothetical protein